MYGETIRLSEISDCTTQTICGSSSSEGYYWILRNFAGKPIEMAYDETLADRTREIISITHHKVQEKKMFGGLCFMVNDKMCLGIQQNSLMVRHDPAKYDEVLEKEGCEPMQFTGKIMQGFVFVDKEVINTNEKLKYWVRLALEYNKIAKPAKKKK
jgi:TfoX/Sxy family transcriptional regulator of competence genes